MYEVKWNTVYKLKGPLMLKKKIKQMRVKLYLYVVIKPLNHVQQIIMPYIFRLKF